MSGHYGLYKDDGVGKQDLCGVNFKRQESQRNKKGKGGNKGRQRKRERENLRKKKAPGTLFSPGQGKKKKKTQEISQPFHSGGKRMTVKKLRKKKKKERKRKEGNIRKMKGGVRGKEEVCGE